MKLCCEFYSYKRNNKNKHLVKLYKLPLLEIKTINKNKKLRSYQVTETSSFGFWSHKQSKIIRNKVSIKSQKISGSNFIAINQAKEEGTNVLSRPRNLFFLFWSQKGSKRTRNKVLIKLWKLVILFFEAMQSKIKRNKSYQAIESSILDFVICIKKIYFLILLMFRS